MKHFTLTLLVLLSSVGFTQQALTETAFLSMVKQNHPLIKISDLQPKYGDAYLIKAKGGFDPKIAGTLNQKYFNLYFKNINLVT